MAALSLATWAATSSSSVSGRSSGVSPGNTTTVDSSSRSSPGIAVMPQAAASPVPRWSNCSTNEMFAHGGASLEIFAVTCSAPCPTTTAVVDGRSRCSASITWRTIARPQIMCSGLGRSERIRVPSPAASTIAETLTPLGLPLRGRRFEALAVLLRGEESNPYSRDQNPLSYRLNDPGPCGDHRSAGRCGTAASVSDLMGSLIKKRRKRMRKKKHKKMLRRTRHQRRK